MNMHFFSTFTYVIYNYLQHIDMNQIIHVHAGRIWIGIILRSGFTVILPETTDR